MKIEGAETLNIVLPCARGAIFHKINKFQKDIENHEKSCLCLCPYAYAYAYAHAYAYAYTPPGHRNTPSGRRNPENRVSTRGPRTLTDP